MTLPLGFQPSFIVLNCDDAPLDFYDHLPLFQEHWASSFLDYLTNGSCNTPLCLPGRAATLTGQRSPHHLGLDNHQGASLNLENTFITALSRKGYRTGGVGKWINGFGEFNKPGGFGVQARQPGFDFHRFIWDAPNYFEYTILSETGVITTYTDSEADYIVDKEKEFCLQFINSVPKNQPFVLYYPSKAPHKDSGSGPTPAPRHANLSIPFTPSPSFGLKPSTYGNPPWMDKAAESPWNPEGKTAVNIEHLEALRTLRSLDESLHAIFTRLQEIGRLESTVIILKTDNAHSYGELRQTDKGTPHRGSSSMLLRVRVPGVAGGMRTQAVSDIDIAPTLCELAGAKMVVQPDGMSFHKTFGDPLAAHREASPMDNVFKDSPLFQGLWFKDGRVYYQGLAGGKAEGSIGGWTDYHQIHDVGHYPLATEKLNIINSKMYQS